MKAGDFLNALTGKHEDPHGSRIRGMNGRVRTFKPAIEAEEFFFIQPARARFLGFCGDTGRGIVYEAKAPSRRVPIVVLRLHPPAIGGADVAPDMIGHRTLAAIVDWSDQFSDFARFNFTSGSIAPK